MKERPIIFDADSVRAILDGRKTQVRIPLRAPQPVDIITKTRYTRELGEKRCWCMLTERDPNHGKMACCRHGEIGDRLWVREVWAFDDVSKPIQPGNGPIYRASWTGTEPQRWRQCIHMPRWASRILLEITNVRVQRVQEITEDDAEAEGVRRSGTLGGKPYSFNTPREAFAATWDSLNAKRGFPWADNPWVWAITFRRLEP